MSNNHYPVQGTHHFYSGFDVELPEHRHSMFLRACRKSDLSIIRSLITHPTLSLPKEKPIMEDGLVLACQHGCLEIVEYLLTSLDLPHHGYPYPDIQHMENFPLRQACKQGHLEVVRFLLSSEQVLKRAGVLADVNKTRDVLVKACESSKLSLVRYLVEDSPCRLQSINPYCLWVCGKADQGEILHYLLHSPRIKERGLQYPDIHHDNDALFSILVNEERWQLLNYLIFDYQISITADIEIIIAENDALAQAFERRTLACKLSGQLEHKDNCSTRNKL